MSEGKWYDVDRIFRESVDGAVKNLENTSIELPGYDDEDERAYNVRASTSDVSLALMDRRMIQSGTGRGKIEFCDLYSDKRVLIHVKRYFGKSSNVSHLFAQAAVSAQLLFADRIFRQELNIALPAGHRLPNPRASIQPRDFEIAYVVVGQPGKDFSLPFFGRVNLRNAAQFLEQLGYDVTFTIIPNVGPL